ncbi:hypothetical protein EDC01DRAFT_22948 [Geopyxis carbonaria]|nr:hypothetical protein EDC01DRAFT_22948 [Geopyxis carbonaria]
MPIPLIGQLYDSGIQSVPYLSSSLKFIPWVFLVWLLKIYFSGTRNGNERVMHSKVAIVTGGTSGIGAAVVEDLAARGMQLILLMKDPTDIFAVDYIEDLRERHGNELIYAEKCDLNDLHSIRRFATKFIDNSPPRRLDMVICCAGLMAPIGAPRTATVDGVESHFGINYLAHFHLLNLLIPVIRVQPADRDVRILLTTCTAHILGELDLNDINFVKRGYPGRRPWRCYGAAKLALMCYGVEFQRRISAYQRPDKEENNVRVFSIDPGYARTLGTRRWISFGSLFGLFIYMVTWPFWWLILKSPDSAAQTILTAAMSPECGAGPGGKYLKECKGQPYRKEGITDPELGNQLWEMSVKMIAELEKESAKRRAIEKKRAKETGEIIKEEEDEVVQDEELKQKLKKKAQEQAAKRRQLEKIIKQEEERTGSLDLPEKVEIPDTPARNTRSKTPKPTPAPEPEARITEVKDTPERPETPSRSTRRRTRKA